MSRGIRAAVLGATGYTGGELVRLILLHPDLELGAVTSEQHHGQLLGAVWPNLLSLSCVDVGALPVLVKADSLLDDMGAMRDLDVVFNALPHGVSAPLVAHIWESFPDVKIVDLSADFRLRDARVYEKWYTQHPASHLLSEAVYGLVEHYDEQIAKARLVACPGCYPTATLVTLLPLLRAGDIDTDAIDSHHPLIVHCLSGVSGAGRSAKVDLLYGEVASQGARPYGVGGHRHWPEISQELARGNEGADVALSFLPHLVPMSRGEMVTCYVPLRVSVEQAWLTLTNYYRYSRMTHVLGIDCMPATGHVAGTNSCCIGLAGVGGEDFIATCAVIDNLVRGSSGQAIQCCNLMFNLGVSRGLEKLVSLLP